MQLLLINLEAISQVREELGLLFLESSLGLDPPYLINWQRIELFVWDEKADGAVIRVV